MKAKLLIIALASIVLSACNSSNSSGFVTSDYKLEFIHFLGTSVYVPNSYVKMSNAERIRRILANDPEIDLDNALVKNYLESLNVSEGEEVMYVDSTALSDIILFVNREHDKGKYFSIDQEELSAYASIMKGVTSREGRSAGYSTTSLDNRFFELSDSKILKMKFEWSSVEEDRYVTNYLIIKSDKTFTTIILNEDGEEFEEMVRRY